MGEVIRSIKIDEPWTEIKEIFVEKIGNSYRVKARISTSIDDYAYIRDISSLHRNGDWIFFDDYTCSIEYDKLSTWARDESAVKGQLSNAHKKYNEGKSKKEEKPKEDSKSEGSSSSSSDDIDLGKCICTKVLFTIIPILPIWWVIKLICKAVWYPINVILWPLRFVFGSCSGMNRDLFPEWRFPTYDF